MTQYIIKLLNADGDPEQLVAQDAAKDDDVIASVELYSHPHGMSVWEGPRLVARIPPISAWGLRLPL